MFVHLIFVAHLRHKNISTMNIFRITVYTMNTLHNVDTLCNATIWVKSGVTALFRSTVIQPRLQYGQAKLAHHWLDHWASFVRCQGAAEDMPSGKSDVSASEQ